MWSWPRGLHTCLRDPGLQPLQTSAYDLVQNVGEWGWSRAAWRLSGYGRAVTQRKEEIEDGKGEVVGCPPAGPAPGVSRLPQGERGNGREDGVARGGGVTGRLLWVWSPSFSVTLGADFELGSVRVPEAKNS